MIKYSKNCIKYFIFAVCYIMLIASAGYSFYQVKQGTPLFNKALRIGDPWYTQIGRNIYHPADYYLEKSQHYLATARTKETQNNLEKSVEIASMALNFRPNNAYTLLVLGTAYAASSQTQKAQDALLRTYDVAPYHRNLSLQRLQIMQAYWPELSNDERRLVLRDVRNLQSVKSWRLNHLARKIPRVKVLIGLADAQDISLE